VAIVENHELRDRLKSAYTGLRSSVNVLGYTAALAAYQHGQPWLEATLRYMTENCHVLMDYVEQELPGIRMSKPEGTYLAWLDCRQSAIPGNPYAFFLHQAGVALVDGSVFGEAGEGFVRLNFGCPRSTLMDALKRMKRALDSLNRAGEA
jgi:cystathionine beta-lyase